MKNRIASPESIPLHLKSYLCTYYYRKTQIMLRMNGRSYVLCRSNSEKCAFLSHSKQVVA